MSEIDHELCRYLLRDEAVRAAEDAAAVPSIQHRDLPEIVADLRERVARLEAAQAALGSGDEIARLTGGEQQPPRGWLTEEEHRAVAFAAKSLRGHAIMGNLKEIADQLDALLARETPPKVKVPSRHVIITTVDARQRIDWIAAIRAAGGEVEW